MSKKYTLLTFKGICMIFSLELKKIILSHPVTSKQPHKIVQILMGHPVELLPVIFWGIRNNWYQSYDFTIIEIGAQKSQSGPIAWPNHYPVEQKETGYFLDQIWQIRL